MKKITLYALVQGLAICLITGLLTLLVKGDFFFRFLAPIFGILAAIMRFGTASLMKVFVPTLYEGSENKKKGDASKDSHQ